MGVAASEHLELGAVVIVMMIVSMVVTARMTGTPALSFVVPVVARALQATVDSQRRVLIVDVDGHDARRGARAPELIIKHGPETRRYGRYEFVDHGLTDRKPLDCRLL